VTMTHTRTISNAYLEAIAFTDCGPDDPERSDATWSEAIFTHADEAVLLYLRRLPDGVLNEVSQAVDDGHYSWDQFGHDLWFTRNGHGVGFWDRGLGQLGDTLTDHAHAMGSVDTYATDDGELAI
jgi:hypothetical protein